LFLSLGSVKYASVALDSRNDFSKSEQLLAIGGGDGAITVLSTVLDFFFGFLHLLILFF
jgi:hypothetical protein